MSDITYLFRKETRSARLGIAIPPDATPPTENVVLSCIRNVYILMYLNRSAPASELNVTVYLDELVSTDEYWRLRPQADG